MSSNNETKKIVRRSLNIALVVAVQELADEMRAEHRPILWQVLDVGHEAAPGKFYVKEYEVDIIVDPIQHPAQQHHLGMRVSRLISSAEYQHVTRELAHKIRQFWFDLADEKLLAQLEDGHKRLMVELLHERYIDVDGYIDQYTRAELENYTGMSQATPRPTIIWDDERLRVLENLKLVTFQNFFPLSRVVTLTPEGQRVAIKLHRLATP